MGEHNQELIKEQEMLQRELEEKKLAKQKILELSQKLDDVGKKIAEEEGLVLKEIKTVKEFREPSSESEDEKEEKKEESSSDEEVDSEGNLILKEVPEGAKPKIGTVVKKDEPKKAEPAPEVIADDMSLDVDDGDSSEQTVNSVNHDLNKPTKSKKE